MPKLKPLTDSRLRKSLRKVSAPQTGWLDVFPAIMGKANGTVLTAIKGIVWVRNVLNGQELTVYNAIAPNQAKLQVEVGRRVDQPGLWQIKGMVEPFSSPSAVGSVAYHHEQHEFPHGDTIWMRRKQMIELTVLVKDADGFIVQVYGGMAGNIKVNSQTVDLSSYVVTTGAKFVGIETDGDGALTVNDGNAFDAPAIATKDDLTVPAAGQYTLAWVLLYESQAELSNNDILIPMPAFFNPLGYLSEINWGDIGGTLADQTDLQAALDALEGGGGGFAEIVMEDGVTFPPVPITTEDGSDWIYDA
jgi:hypothetical protein